MASVPYTPGTFDWQWVRGTTTPVIFTLQSNGDPMTFDDVRLSVYKDNGRTLAFRVSLSDGTMTLTNPATSEITFTPTPEQTRSLSESKIDADPKNRYELEVRDNGAEQVYLLGMIRAIGGLNDDEEEAS